MKKESKRKRSVMLKKKELELEERDGGDGVPVCRAERCAVHHLQTGRQGCLGSLFLPRYTYKSLDQLQQAGSTFLWF